MSMQLLKYLLPSLVSVSLLSGCSLFNSEEDVNKMAALPKVENQFTASILWHVSVGDGIGDYYSNLHPAFKNNMVYAADRMGIVKAVNVENGKLFWETNLSTKTGLFSARKSSLLSGGITVDSQHLYIGSERGEVYALNRKDGRVAWHVPVAGEALSSPVVSDDLLLIHTSNGMLQALDTAAGTSKWVVNLGSSSLTLRGESAPTVAVGGAIVGADNGRVNAVLINQGQLVWQQQISQTTGSSEIDRLNDVDTTPVVSKGVVYAQAYNGNLVALDLRNGQIQWKREIGGVKNLLVLEDRIYLIDQNDRINVLSTDNGVPIWRQSDLLHRNLTAPVIFDSYLVTADSEGYVHWLNTTNGRFVSQQKIDGSGIQAQPLVAGDKLLLQAQNGELYALKR